jgi:Bacterial Ig-like domain (group 3)/Divergent InlB B-repeat domain
VARGTAGNDTPTTTVDSATVFTTINILDSVTVTTNPSGLLITVDGTAYTAPQTFNWVVGSSHILNTTSPQNVSGGSEQVWSSWSQGGTQSQTVTAPTAATNYTANFTTEYQLTTLASPSADGSVTPAPGSYYAANAIVPVTATANAGFHFNNWTSTGGSFDSTASASTNFHMPGAPATVTGNFASAAVQIAITTSPANLLVSADGGPFTAAPLVETWIPGSTHTIATSSPQAGGTGVQYVWSSWSDGGPISHTITVPSTANTYTATFSTQYQLTTAANPGNGGTVSPPSGNFYAAGTVVPLTATPDAGFTFSSWTGNVANASSASTTVTMSAPETITANFAASASPTTTTLMSSLSPSTYGDSVTFTATVTSSGNGTPNGQVNFKRGTISLGVVKLAGGSASLTTSALNAGSHVITAHYSGSTNYVASSSSTLTQTVNKVATTTTITNASPSPSTYGDPVTFTATVSTNVGSASGNVVFKRGSLVLGSGTLSGGNASYTTTVTQIPGGEDAITAVYTGDSNHDASTSAAYRQTVDEEATTTLVITSGSPSNQGSSVTFTASVSANVGTPGGNVAFRDGTTLLGTVALSGGTAQFTTSGLAVGTHTIHAHYQGTGSYAVSAGEVPQVVQ